MNFGELAGRSAALGGQPLFLLGVLLVLAGLGFKIAAVPLQIWAPDVYQGAPTPTTLFWPWDRRRRVLCCCCGCCLVPYRM